TAMGTIGYSTEVQDSLARVGGPAVPALIAILNGSDTSMRVCAAEALGEIGPAARAAIPLLIRAIEHPDDNPHADPLLFQAVRARGRIGPAASVAVPILNGLLDRYAQDEDKKSEELDVILALDRIGAAPVRRLCEAYRCDRHWSLAYQLTLLGPKARATAPI